MRADNRIHIVTAAKQRHELTRAIDEFELPHGRRERAVRDAGAVCSGGDRATDRDVGE